MGFVATILRRSRRGLSDARAETVALESRAAKAIRWIHAGKEIRCRVNVFSVGQWLVSSWMHWATVVSACSPALTVYGLKEVYE